MAKKAETKTARLSIGKMRDEEKAAVVGMLSCMHKEHGGVHPTTHHPISETDAEAWAHNLVAALSEKRPDALLVARYGSKPIGVTAWNLETNAFGVKTAVIQGIYVNESQRRKGIASKLLVRLRALLDKEKTTDFVEAGVYAEDARALNLLRNTGFFTHQHRVLLRLKPTKPDAMKAEAARRKRKAESEKQERKPKKDGKS